MIRVLMLPVDGQPFLTEIGSDLAAMQRAVGGFIEALTVCRLSPGHRLVLVCNEDGRRLELSPNPHVPECVGTCFVTHANDGTGQFESLSDEDVRALPRLGGIFERWTLS